MRNKLFLTIATLLFAGTAAAYVGPGAGISVLGALWGLIIGVVMAVGVILFWPIRMMLRKAKANKAEAENNTASDSSAAQDTDNESEASSQPPPSQMS